MSKLSERRLTFTEDSESSYSTRRGILSLEPEDKTLKSNGDAIDKSCTVNPGNSNVTLQINNLSDKYFYAAVAQFFSEKQVKRVLGLLGEDKLTMHCGDNLENISAQLLVKKSDRSSKTEISTEKTDSSTTDQEENVTIMSESTREKLRGFHFHTKLETEKFNDEKIRFGLPKNLEINDDFSGVAIYITYRGRYSETMNGLYKVKYTENNEEREYAITQFESTAFRKVFILVDQPSFLLNIELTVIYKGKIKEHENEDVIDVFSNTPTNEKYESNGYVHQQFEHLENCSPYLVAIAIGKFRIVELTEKSYLNHVNELKKVFGKREKELPKIGCIIENSSLDAETRCQYALYCSYLVTMYLELVGIPYRYKNVYIMAVKEFAAGAMENWGLITFRETMLLTEPKKKDDEDEKKFKEREKRREEEIRVVVSHEFGHNIFGGRCVMEKYKDIFVVESANSLQEILITCVIEMLIKAKSKNFASYKDLKYYVTNNLTDDEKVAFKLLEKRRALLDDYTPFSLCSRKSLTSTEIELTFSELAYNLACIQIAAINVFRCTQNGKESVMGSFFEFIENHLKTINVLKAEDFAEKLMMLDEIKSKKELYEKYIKSFLFEHPTYTIVDCEYRGNLFQLNHSDGFKDRVTMIILIDPQGKKTRIEWLKKNETISVDGQFILSSPYNIHVMKYTPQAFEKMKRNIKNPKFHESNRPLRKTYLQGMELDLQFLFRRGYLADFDLETFPVKTGIASAILGIQERYYDEKSTLTEETITETRLSNSDSNSQSLKELDKKLRKIHEDASRNSGNDLEKDFDELKNSLERLEINDFDELEAIGTKLFNETLLKINKCHVVSYLTRVLMGQMIFSHYIIEKLENDEKVKEKIESIATIDYSTLFCALAQMTGTSNSLKNLLEKWLLKDNGRKELNKIVLNQVTEIKKANRKIEAQLSPNTSQSQLSKYDVTYSVQICKNCALDLTDSVPIDGINLQPNRKPTAEAASENTDV